MIVTVMIVSGLRVTCRSVRPSMRPVSPTRRGAHAALPVPRRRPWCCPCRGAAAGDREEDLFEAGLPLHHLHPGRRHEPAQLGQGPVHDDRALVEDGDPVGQRLGLLQLLGGEDDRGPAVGQVLHDPPHLEAALGVQAGGGLVEEQHPRPAQQAHGDVEPAPHPAGVRARPPAARRRRGRTGRAGRRRRPRGSGDPPEPGHEEQVLAAGEDLVHGGELAGEADGLPHPLRLGRRRRGRRRRRCRGRAAAGC